MVVQSVEIRQKTPRIDATGDSAVRNSRDPHPQGRGCRIAGYLDHLTTRGRVGRQERPSHVASAGVDEMGTPTRPMVPRAFAFALEDRLGLVGARFGVRFHEFFDLVHEIPRLFRGGPNEIEGACERLV